MSTPLVRLWVSRELYTSPQWRLPPGFTMTAVRLKDNTYELDIEGPFPPAVDGELLSAVVYRQDGGRPNLWVWTYRGAAIGDPIPMPPVPVDDFGGETDPGKVQAALERFNANG